MLNKKMQLIEAVQDCFGENEEDLELEAKEDLAILYEITGFQGDNPTNDADFWANYANYKSNGSLEQLISLNQSDDDD